MSKGRSRRAGFTLPEVLVTVAIVAILAAVVVPAVTNQISKGETGSVASAVTSYSTGVTAFVTDVRRYPQYLSQLTNKIQNTDNDLDNRPYGAASASGWRGPYTSAVTHTLGDSAPIGLAAYAVDTLRDTTLGSGATARRYMVMSIATGDTSVARQIDVLLDRGDGNAAGVLQWGVTSDSVTVRRLRYFMTPR